MPELRAMEMIDINRVLKIIEAHDEDDAEAAESDYDEDGIEHQFVLEMDGEIIGITGYREVEATDGSIWLNWTYLAEPCRGQGHGKAMLQELIGKLRDKDARKLFVKVSDYEDSELGKIYEQAYRTYESLGFEAEVVSNDFYDVGENQHILGLTIRQQVDHDFEEPANVVEEKPIIRFNGLLELAETEGSYTFTWVVNSRKKLFGKRNFSVEDLVIGLQTVKEQGGRKIFLTFPSNLPLIHQPLQAAGFKYVGQLSDYYEQGVHELHFTHDLGQV